MMKILFSLAFFILNAAIFWWAIRRCQRNCFMSDTLPLMPLGIFVWGDALVLAPFWMLSSVAFWWLSWLGIFRWFLLFYIIREVYEVVYWLNHQAVKNTYRPPFLRNTPWLNTEQASIIYQLLAMCQVVLAAAALLFTYHLL